MTASRSVKTNCTCLAIFFVLLGLCMALGVGIFVPVFTSVFHFNTQLIEEVVLDEFDSLDDQAAWRNFIWGSSRRISANAVQDSDRERLESAVLHQFYVFAMQNMPEVVERRSTAKKYPFVKQYGPYGYREFVEVYDVRFINPGLGNHGGSDLVTFKSWSYYQPLAGDESCRLEDGRLELTGALPTCLDDTVEFTMLNRQFLQYIQEHSSAGVVGKVGHKLFADVKDIFTSFRGPFLTSLRLWELPPVLERISNLQAVRKIPGALKDVRDYRDEYAPMLYTPSNLPMMRPLYETYPRPGGVGYRSFNTSTGAQYAGARYATIPYSATVSAFVRQNKRNSGYIFGRMKPSVNGSLAACCWCLSMNGDDAENDFRFEFTAPDGTQSENSPAYSPWSIGARFDRDDGPDEGLNVRGKWHQITMVVKELNNGNVFSQAYVDGLPYRQASIIPRNKFDPNCPGGRVYVGGSPFATRPKVFDGLLSDVRFYDRALTEIEVLSIYRSPSTHDALSKLARIYCGETQNSDEKPGQLKDTCPFGSAASILDFANATSPPVIKWLQTGRVAGVRDPTDPRVDWGDCGREECGGGVCDRGICECAKTDKDGNVQYCVEWRALTSFQTHYLLDAPADLVVSNEPARVIGAPMDPIFRTGFHYWVNASEHFYNFNHNEGPEKDAINQAAYETLIQVMKHNDYDLNEERTAFTPVEYRIPPELLSSGVTNNTVKHLINKARVDGLLRYFFDAERDGWINERATKQKVARDWSTQPVNTIACEKHSETTCKWELQPFMKFLGIGELPTFAYTGEGNSQEPTPTQRSLLLSVRQARMLIDPAYKFQDMDLDRGLSGSLLNQQTVPRTWGLAFHYCDAWRHSRDMTCGGMRRAIEMGKEILPKYLAKVDLIQAAVYENNIWPKYKYELQTCIIADYVVNNWLMNNTWYDEQLAKIINRDFAAYWNKDASGGMQPMTPARLPELGYLQWATSFYTLERFGKMSLAEMPDSGNTLSSGVRSNPVEPVLHARFNFLSITDDEVDREPLEFGGIAILDGFPAAANPGNFSIEDARMLLDALADSDSATRTNPRDTLGEGLIRGATELLIGQTVNVSNMPQPDVYLRRKNQWFFNTSRAHAGWFTHAIRKDYDVLVGDGSPGRPPQRSLNQYTDGAANEQRTFFELHQLDRASEARWEDPNGRNLERGYAYPSLALDNLLEQSFATDERQSDGMAVHEARAARNAAWAACIRWRFCPSQGSPTMDEGNATADIPFLVSLMLSMPGGERSLTADQALAECRLFWGQDTLGGARLLDQDIHDCPDFWAFRNVLRLNATADYFGCDTCSMRSRLGRSECETCIQVRWKDANGNTHDVLRQHFERARAAFFEVAELFDEANRLTHAAEVPSDEVVVAIDTATTSVLAQSPSPLNLQPVRGCVSIVAGLKNLAQARPQLDPLRVSGLYVKANGLGDLRLPSAQLVRPLKKRATILAGMIQSYVINGFFLRRRLWCSGDPKVCDYRRGGLFTTQTVRNYLFEGYTDTLFSELASNNFARHGYRYGCVDPTRIMTTWDCRPIYDMDCSKKGFELSIADVQTVTTRADNYQSIVDGNFTLSWNGAETENISFSAAPSVVKHALEALSPIGTVHVTRSVQRVAISPSLLETRHGDLGYTWTITFASEKGDLPLLKAPEQSLLTLDGTKTIWSGSGDAVWVQKLHAGVHPGAAFEPLTVYDRNSARSTGEWYRRALTVPDLGVPGWACVPPCQRYEDARPTILLSNPAFTARDMWYGDNWHGATWRNEKWRREMNCARSARGGISAAGGEALSTIFYEYPLRYASCEHTVRTGRLDARAVMQRVRHYGNESIGFWNGTEYYGNPQAVQHAADLKTSVVTAVVGGRDTWRQHTPFMFPGFMQEYDKQGDPGPLEIWNRDVSMRMLYSKVEKKFNSRPADEFDYSPVRRVELQGTQNLTGDVKISVNRYCADVNAYNGTAMEGEPVGLLNLRPMSNSDLMIGPPHHLGVQIPWLAEGSLDLTIDGMYPQPGSHTSCVDIEPVTGQTLRYYLRRQYSYKMTRDALFPQFVHGTLCSHRIPACLRPGSNPPEYAEANYVPMFWKQESNVITPVNAWTMQEGVLNKYIEAQTLSMQALSLAGGCFLLGLVALWCTLGRRCCGCFFKDEAKILKID